MKASLSVFVLQARWNVNRVTESPNINPMTKEITMFLDNGTCILIITGKNQKTFYTWVQIHKTVLKASQIKVLCVTNSIMCHIATNMSWVSHLFGPKSPKTLHDWFGDTLHSNLICDALGVKLLYRGPLDPPSKLFHGSAPSDFV